MLFFSGEDYEVIERGLTIDPTTTRIPFRVEIIDDSICEDKEVFSLSQSLTSDDDPISIVNDIRITIADADDCCMLCYPLPPVVYSSLYL